jgi:hypothetical protein
MLLRVCYRYQITDGRNILLYPWPPRWYTGTCPYCHDVTELCSDSLVRNSCRACSVEFAVANQDVIAACFKGRSLTPASPEYAEWRRTFDVVEQRAAVFQSWRLHALEP